LIVFVANIYLGVIEIGACQKIAQDQLGNVQLFFCVESQWDDLTIIFHTYSEISHFIISNIYINISHRSPPQSIVGCIDKNLIKYLCGTV
jgi:hypothetical protein